MNKTPFADLNAVTKKIELEELSKGHVYPVTIVEDRYGGSYSGSKWLAFQLDSDQIPEEIGGGDPEESIFWMEHSDEILPIGKGENPNEALEDLKIKLKSFYEQW